MLHSVQEALRLHHAGNPMYSPCRLCTEEVELGGYIIPKGTGVMLNMVGMAVDDKWFPRHAVSSFHCFLKHIHIVSLFFILRLGVWLLRMMASGLKAMQVPHWHHCSRSGVQVHLGVWPICRVEADESYRHRVPAGISTRAPHTRNTRYWS